MRFLTLTLHPAIDRVLRVAELIPGGTFDAKLEASVPSGKGVNTARSLSAFVRAPDTVAAAVWVGAGEAAWFAKESARISRVRSLVCTRNCVTRTASTILEVNGRETHIKEAMDSPDAGEQSKLLEFWARAVKPGDIVAVCGSAPKGTAPAVLRAIFRIAKEKRAASVIADTNGPALEIAATSGINGIKGNALELGALLGLSAPLDVSIIGHREALQGALSRRGGPASILVTFGKDGALIVTANEILVARPPAIESKFIVTATGAGDAATAGWMQSIRDNSSPAETLRRVVACGCAKLASSDPGKLDPRRVNAYLREITAAPLKDTTE